jgi:hypothetical protein
MNRKLLPGLVGALWILGCACATAMPADDMSISRYTAADELARSATYAVDAVEGKWVREDAARPVAFVTDAGAAAYASQSALVTVVLLAAAAIVLAGLAAAGKALAGNRRGPEAPKADWRESLLEMLEADLRNLDSLTHGYSGR